MCECVTVSVSMHASKHAQKLLANANGGGGGGEVSHYLSPLLVRK